MKRNKAQSQILQFRLSVKDVKPEIWRKIIVSSDITLAKFHTILQVLMGWKGNHLYAFTIDKKCYSLPIENDTDNGKKNSISTTLSRVFSKGTKFITYEYDFGDEWEIDIYNEPRDSSFQHNLSAECIEGSRHGPVENSGGSRGYMEKALIYGNPQHKRYREIRKLIGPNFDPEAFDIISTNEMLKEIG